MIRAMRAAGVGHCVVNATSEADWPAVEALALAYPDFIYPAFGLHPWKAHTATDGWAERLETLLVNHPRSSIGECGLDGWISSPPLEIQRRVFMAQLELARKICRPVTIHCLKAWAPLFDVFTECSPPPRFLMHSFGGSIEIARRLISLGAYFSFSGHFLHSRKASVIEVFRQLPRERILLETDAPDMRPPDEMITHPLTGALNHPANLPAIGRALAAKLGLLPEDLAILTRANAAALFR